MHSDNQVLWGGMHYRVFILLSDQEQDKGVRDSGGKSQIAKAADSRGDQVTWEKITLTYS